MRLNQGVSESGSWYEQLFCRFDGLTNISSQNGAELILCDCGGGFSPLRSLASDTYPILKVEPLI
jgi:hypothetical protein